MECEEFLAGFVELGDADLDFPGAVVAKQIHFVIYDRQLVPQFSLILVFLVLLAVGQQLEFGPREVGFEGSQVIGGLLLVVVLLARKNILLPVFIPQ